MKNRIAMIAICCAALLFGGSTYAFANGAAEPTEEERPEPAAAMEADVDHHALTARMEAEAQRLLNEKRAIVPQPAREIEARIDPYESALAKATTDAQKEAIRSLEEEAPIAFMYPRKLMTILGELPEDRPRITVEEVKAALNMARSSDGVDMKILMDEMNKIHGAPDLEGGSGLHHIIYALKDDGSMSVNIMYGNVTLYTYDGDDRTRPAMYDLIKDEPILPEPTTAPADVIVP